MAMRFAAVLLLIAALLTGCGSSGATDPGPAPTEPVQPTPPNQPTLPARPPYVTGVITQLEADRVLVEENPDTQVGQKCWFAVTAKTVVAMEKQGKQTAADRRALSVKQVVRAWESGPILESYPCQTGGEALLIIESK